MLRRMHGGMVLVAIVASLPLALPHYAQPAGNRGPQSSPDQLALPQIELGPLAESLKKLQSRPHSQRQALSLNLKAIPAPHLVAMDESMSQPALGGDLILRIAWEAVSGAQSYEWQLWTGKACRGHLVAFGDVGPSQLSAEVKGSDYPLPEGQYFWKVRAFGDGLAAADSPWGCGNDFRLGSLVCTGPALEAPSGLMADGQACGAYLHASVNSPLLQWGSLALASGYRYEVWTGIDCTGSLAASGTTASNETSATPSPLAEGTYFWRVQAMGDGSATCDSPWSATCAFTVGSPSCEGTTLTDPVISDYTLWDISGSPYLIAGMLHIDFTGILVVEAGVIVKFSPSAWVVVDGMLFVDGTSSSRVVFGSLNDHTLCGPSPGATGNPQPGDWGGIYALGAGGVIAANLTVRHASIGVDLSGMNGDFFFDNLRVSSCDYGVATQDTQAVFSNALIESCINWFGVISVGNDFASFTNLDFYDATLQLEGKSRAAFIGGIWDGAGTRMTAGTVSYSVAETPDPSFEGVLIQNMAPEGTPALEAQGTVWKTTHWAGVPFLLNGLSINYGGCVYASDTTLYLPGEFNVEGFLSLGAPGTTTLVRGIVDSPWSWHTIAFLPGSSGLVTNCVIQNARQGMDIQTAGVFRCENTVLSRCGEIWSGGIHVGGGAAPVFTNLTLNQSPLLIDGDSRPSFTGGVWDGGGEQLNAGVLDYSLGTPDPLFQGITIQNMAPGGILALAIQGTVAGATHWKGIPFVMGYTIISSQGRVDASDTTLYVDGGEIYVEGQLDLGAPGTTTLVRGASDIQGSWSGIIYSPNSAGGSVSHTTIRHASCGLDIQTPWGFQSDSLTVSLSGGDSWCGGVHVGGYAAPVFTNLTMDRSPLRIDGAARPSFIGGTWDGGGELLNAGWLDYSGSAPDPTFRSVTIQNMVDANALEITGGGIYSGTTHWVGIPFLFNWSTFYIAGLSRVDVYDTTLLMQGGGTGLMVESGGRLNLGRAGTLTEVRSSDGSPYPGAWAGITFWADGGGQITSATIRDADTALDIRTNNLLIVSNSQIFSCNRGLWILPMYPTPSIQRFTNLNLILPQKPSFRRRQAGDKQFPRAADCLARGSADPGGQHGIAVLSRRGPSAWSDMRQNRCFPRMEPRFLPMGLFPEHASAAA